MAPRAKPFPRPLRRVAPWPREPARGADKRSGARLGRRLLLSGVPLRLRSCLARTRFAFSQPIRRYSRVPERSRVLLGLGRLLPAAGTPQPSSLLPSLSTSSTPRGVAPPCPRVRPRNLPSLCSLFPSLCCQPVALGIVLRRAAWVSPASYRHLRAFASRSRRVSHPQLAASDPDSGSRALTPPLPRTRALPARPLPGAGRGAQGCLPLLPRSPRAPALALSKASALSAGALRAPASPGSCQCGDCAGKHGDRGNDPH